MPSSTEMAIKCLSSLRSCCWFLRTLSPPSVPAWVPVGVWVLSLAAVRQFFFLAQHLRFAHCCFVWNVISFGLICPDLKPISKAGSKAYFQMETCTTTYDPSSSAFTQTAEHSVWFYTLFCFVSSPPDGNIPKVRKLGLPFFFPFAWLACGSSSQTGPGPEPVCTLCSCGPELLDSQRSSSITFFIFYTYHCKIINLIPQPS